MGDILSLLAVASGDEGHRKAYSSECVEVAFSEVRMQDPG
jgi:hypothetical protein